MHFATGSVGHAIPRTYLSNRIALIPEYALRRVALAVLFLSLIFGLWAPSARAQQPEWAAFGSLLVPGVGQGG
jgi:hypothetical protein